MMSKITGQVLEAESGRGVPGVIVRAFDKDRFFDDLLGEVMTDAGGEFQLMYDESKFREFFDTAPDIFLTVKTVSGRMLFTTEGSIRFNAASDEEFRLQVPAEALRAAGIHSAEPRRAISSETLTTLTCLQNLDVEDDLVKQIKADLEGKSSILEMMKEYMVDLEGELDNNALPYRKLKRLFELGSTLDRMEGHHYGIAIGLRTGDLSGLVADYGNLLGYIWGEAIGGVCPWVGKSFTPMAEGDRRQVTGTTLADDLQVYRGINHFNVIEHAPVNVAGNALLIFMWNLKEVADAERLYYGHERNGGHFVSHRALSVYHGTPREVFVLNYRYSGLDNAPPLIYLIDELVGIADGLYLGQLLFATARLLERYDPMAKNVTYSYQHFGYFLLFREDWNVEAKRLFPHLEMPEAAVRTRITLAESPDEQATPRFADKFSTFTLADPPDGNVDPVIMAEIQQDLMDSGTVIHLLKSYSDALDEDPDSESPVFKKLHTLFNAGIAPTTMDGFYRGARITFQSQGLLRIFDINTLNIVWQAARFFSPWTGKSFGPVDPARLEELTDGHERMDVPTFFCSNTVVFRTPKEKAIRNIMQLVGAWMEDATELEQRLFGFQAHAFFFIGKAADSILPANEGKRIFQFNYRWKKLRTPPPDNFCIDEIVQIAEGLYLGQLIYATDLLKPWDPLTNPKDYDYRLFGYFLLMDEEWHSRRLRIGFDLENV